jgi:hypothetical protein
LVYVSERQKTSTMSSPPPRIPTTTPTPPSTSTPALAGAAMATQASSTAMDASQRSQSSGQSQSQSQAQAQSQQQATTSNKTTNTTGMSTSTSTSTPTPTPTDQAVLEYLKSKGMGSALLELQAKLKADNTKDPHHSPKGGGGSKGSDASSATNNNSNKPAVLSMTEQLEYDDDIARNQRLALTKSTGGGFGYDRDAAAPIVQWGVPDNTQEGDKEAMGVKEARAYLDAFTALQLWVLTLPDDHVGMGSNVQTQTHNVIAKAQALIKQGQKDPSKKVSLSTMMGELSKPAPEHAMDSTNTNTSTHTTFHLPPSAKPELLAVTFALLVHTYCELLEVGMETTAHVLRDAFQPIYQPLFGEQLKDLFHCTTTEDMVKLNTHNSQHMEALANLKSILVQIASLQLRKEEVSQAQVSDPAQKEAQKAKLHSCNKNITNSVNAPVKPLIACTICLFCDGPEPFDGSSPCRLPRMDCWPAF